MKKSIIIAAAAICSITSQAQYDQEIISVGDRTLTVDAAYKISDIPTTIDTIPRSYELQYSLLPKQVEVAYSPKPIKPANLKVIEPLSKLYRGYVKAGVGVYTSPLLEFNYNGLRNRDWAYGIKGRHFSSQGGGLKDVAESSFGENHFGGWVKRYINKHTIEAGIGYDLDRIHYYGFNPADLDVKSKDYRQTYRTIGGRVDVQSHYQDSAKVQHQVYVDIRNTQAEKDVAENNVLVGVEASKTIDAYRFSLGMALDINSYTTPGKVRVIAPSLFEDLSQPRDIEQKGTIFRFEPKIHARKDDLTADIGIDIASDSGPDPNKLRLYPQAYLSYSLFDDLFTPYAGITGGLERTSFKSISDENPFILSSVGLRNQSKNMELYGGIRGTILDDLAFNARISVGDYDDFAFFVNDTIFAAENAFQVVYDDLRVVRLAGELTYKQSDQFTLGARLELMSNKADKLERAFNLPAVSFTLDGRYELDDTFVVKAQIFAEGKRYGATSRPQDGDDASNAREDGLYDVTLRGYVDGSLGLEYRYTKRISAFLDINNLTGGRYARWYRFPTQAAMVMGGVTFSF